MTPGKWYISWIYGNDLLKMLKDEDTSNTFKRHTKHLKLQYMTEMLFTLYEILKKKKRRRRKTLHFTKENASY